MARILFLTQVLPYPLDSGAKIRAYYVLRHLARGHQVTLVSFTRADDRPEYVAHLERFCQAVHTAPMRRSRFRDARALLVAGLSGQPVVIVRDEMAGMQATLRRLVREEAFDVIHADQTSMAQYALYAGAHLRRGVGRRQIPNSGSQPRARLLLDAHNALYRIPERLAPHEGNPVKRLLLRREARALARYEAGLLARFDQVVFVADQDRQALQEKVAIRHSPFAIRHSPISNLEKRFPTIPICVDPEEQPLIQRAPQPRAITHLGTMFWPPNVEGVLWFAQEVFPRVLARAPQARFVIIGKNPPQEVRALASGNEATQVTGYVPDPAPYLAETAVFIVPVRAAGGMRVKIPDAWCWGLPIVSTSIGAEGIELGDGRQALIADTPQALAEAVLRVLEDPALGERLRKSGRRWVEERYNWRQVYAVWDEVYERLVDEG